MSTCKVYHADRYVRYGIDEAIVIAPDEEVAQALLAANWSPSGQVGHYSLEEIGTASQGQEARVVMRSQWHS